MNTLTKLTLLVLVVGACVSNALAGSLVTYEYDKYGNRTAITTGTKDGPVLEKTTYTYDDYRRPTSKTEAAQDGSSRTWIWTYERYFPGNPNQYDPGAHTSRQWRLQYEPAYDAAGHRNVTARWFDYNDRIVDEYTGLIDTPGAGMSAGPDLEVHHLGYDENGQKNDYIDPRGRETTYTYDLRNRLWKTTEPLNRITETLYDFAGNKTDVIFPDTKSQHWLFYDAFGQPRQFKDERNNITDLSYWPFGPMKKLQLVVTHRTKDDGGIEDQPTTFYYDHLGRPQTTVFPDHSEEWTFYDLGQVATFVTRKGQWKHISYDVRGREVYHYWDDDAAPAIRRSWDDANRLRTLCNIYSTIAFEYDGAGLVKTETNTIAGSGGPVPTTYERYSNGNVSRIIYPQGSSIRRDYNSRGQLSATGSSDGNNNWSVQYATYKYLADGKLDYQDYGNGVHTAFAYDERGLLKQETVTRGGLMYADRTYTRDNRDRIISFRKGVSSANPMENGRGDRFRYDEEGQLVEAWYNAADPANSGAGNNRYDGFTYDALGNRMGADPAHPLNFIASRGSMSFTRDNNGLNQYGSWGGSPVQHDDDIGGTWGSPAHANGVLMFEGTITAGFNALNQPMFINTASAGWVSFGYDPLGRCVKRWAGLAPEATANPATYFYYDGWNLIQEGPSANTFSQLYILGNRVDEIVADYAVANGQWMFHSSDGRGHAMLLTASNGSLAEQYEYDAFGQPYFFSSTAQPLNSSTFGNRFLFTGREWLGSLEIYDYRNRMYQPELGRFLQPDPKEFGAGDYNLYRYCHNDPVNRSDPTGLDASSSDQILNKSTLTGQGQGDWKQEGSPFTKAEILGKVKEYVSSINTAVKNAVNKANKASRNVKWSANVSNWLKDSKDFGNPKDIATTDWSAKSAPVMNANGAVESFNVNLQININWNASKSFYFGSALITDNTNWLHKTGEIEHTRDALGALTSPYGGARAAVDIANEQAASMVGHYMGEGWASSRMDFALGGWADATMVESLAARDLRSMEHKY